jgi:hypothetical protein
MSLCRYPLECMNSILVICRNHIQKKSGYNHSFFFLEYAGELRIISSIEERKFVQHTHETRTKQTELHSRLLNRGQHDLISNHTASC